MALTNTRMKAVLDAEFEAGDADPSGSHCYIVFSETGSGTSSNVAALSASAFGGWAANASADPYYVQNASACESASATGSATITHWATASASTGALGTIWIPVTGTDPVLITGGKLSVAAGALKPCSLDRTTTP
jgi:hypothetical protein